MRKLLVLVVLLGLSAFGFGQEISSLGDVHKVYVDTVASFGDLHGAESFRENLVRKLAESKQLVVVDDPAQADAILTRAVDGDYTFAGKAMHLSVDSAKSADVNLILTSPSKKTIVWMNGESLPQWAIAGRTSTAANKIVKRLLEDIKKSVK
jgi:hypothetical protein